MAKRDGDGADLVTWARSEEKQEEIISSEAMQRLAVTALVIVATRG